jgi:hypothetical protein
LWREPESRTAGPKPAPRSYPENESYLAGEAGRLVRGSGPKAAVDLLRRWEQVGRDKWGHADPVCLGWLATGLAEQGQAAAARQKLAELHEMRRQRWCRAEAAVTAAYEQALSRVGEVAVPADEEAVRQRMIEACEALWVDRDGGRFLSYWSGEGRFIDGRLPAPGPADVVRDRPTLPRFLRLWVAGPESPTVRRNYVVEQVEVRGPEATGRVRGIVRFWHGYQAFTLRFQARQEGGVWKLRETRTTLDRVRNHQEVAVMDEAWAKQKDAEVEAMRATKDLRKVQDALFWARRYAEAHAVSKQITEQERPTAQDWVYRANSALHANVLDDVGPSVRQARRRDSKIALEPRLEAAMKEP